MKTSLNIVTMIVMFCIVVVLFVYLLKENQRRKKIDQDSDLIEVHFYFRCCTLAYISGVLLYTVLTIVVALNVFPGMKENGYLILCLLISIFWLLTFTLTSYKVILNKNTRKITMYRYFGKKEFSIEDITNFKETSASLNVFFGNKLGVVFPFSFTTYSDEVRKYLVKKDSNDVVL